MLSYGLRRATNLLLQAPLEREADLAYLLLLGLVVPMVRLVLEDQVVLVGRAAPSVQEGSISQEHHLVQVHLGGQVGLAAQVDLVDIVGMVEELLNRTAKGVAFLVCPEVPVRQVVLAVRAFPVVLSGQVDQACSNLCMIPLPHHRRHVRQFASQQRLRKSHIPTVEVFGCYLFGLVLSLDTEFRRLHPSQIPQKE